MAPPAARTGLQAILMALYAGAKRSGLLQSGPGRWLFEWAYVLYKDRHEGAAIAHLRKFVQPGSVVIDVGANIGVFTARFADWTGPQGRVLAIEPEAQNFARLAAMITARGFEHRVEPIKAAATDAPGTALLQLNPVHPGDHRLATDGVAVTAVALDDLLAARGWPPVSLVKIDVQGAELRVLAGAREMLRRCRPALFIEIDDAALRGQGDSVLSLLSFLEAVGYAPAAVAEDHALTPAGADEIRMRLRHSASYEDVLFLPTDTKD